MAEAPRHTPPAGRSQPGRRAVRRLVLTLIVATTALCAGLLMALAQAQPAAAHTVLRGLGGAAPAFPTSTGDDTAWKVVAAELHPQVVRVDVAWPALEPKRGVFNDVLLQRLVTGIDTMGASGVKVLVQVEGVPRWASNSSFWAHPMPGGSRGYRSYYPIRRDRLGDLRLCINHLSDACKGKVLAYICWNEPNLGWHLYPQRTGTDSAFAAHVYARMLKAFSAGVRAGDPGAKVVAGETAPSGRNDRLSTSPQRFARLLRGTGAGRWFDVYSHHPYVVGGSKNIAPEAPVASPAYSVALSNLRTLLRVFPGKPFYLTEFAYSTHFSFHFGIATSESGQAAYLRRAYAVAGRYSQVKMMVWWMLRDQSDHNTYRDQWGWYMGLRRLDDGRKPAYYAFAGGTKITLDPPPAVRHGAGTTLRGVLSNRSITAVGGKPLRVQVRNGGRWVTVGIVPTQSSGAYAAGVRPKASAYWRVVWPGVARSPAQRLIVN